MSFLKNSSHQLLLGVVVSMLIAFLFPWNASYGIDLKNLVSWGIVGIFFFYGLKVDLKESVKDVSNWKLHLFIQLFTFLIFPLIILVFYPFFTENEYFPLWLSVFFLAALPSTVSSAVIMTSVAKGNIPAAILNATITGLIGLLVTPLWVGIFLKKSSLDLDFISIFWDLTKQILIPVIAGLLLNKLLKKYTLKSKPFLSWYDKIIIFIIIYKSFSAAITDDIFASFSWGIIATLFIVLTLLFVVVYLLVLKSTTLLNFSLKDRKTAIFSATQKSLVHGSVFVIILIPDVKKQTLILLAVMIYHTLQIIFTSFIASRFQKKLEIE